MLHNSQIKDIHQRNQTIIKHPTPVSPQLRSGQYHGNKMVNMATNRSPNMVTNRSPNMQQRKLQHAVSAQNISSASCSLDPNVVPNSYQLTQSANHDCSITMKYGGGNGMSHPSSPLPPALQIPQTEMMPHSHRMDDRARGMSRSPIPLPSPLPSPVMQLPPPKMTPHSPRMDDRIDRRRGISHSPSPLPLPLASPVLQLPPPEMTPNSPKMYCHSSPLPLTPTENSPRIDDRRRGIFCSPSPLPSPVLQVPSHEKMPHSPEVPCSSSPSPFTPPAIQLPQTEMIPHSPNMDGRSRAMTMITSSPKPRQHPVLQKSKFDNSTTHKHRQNEMIMAGDLDKFRLNIPSTKYSDGQLYSLSSVCVSFLSLWYHNE